MDNMRFKISTTGPARNNQVMIAIALPTILVDNPGVFVEAFV
jgi:hypothetical protein